MSGPAHVVVATIVQRDDGRFLFVEESIGARRSVLNQPAGHWEAGETLLAGAVRETLEETAWDVKPTALLGIYEHKPADLDYGFLRFAFLADAVRHHPQRALDSGIERAVWMSRDELATESARHRSPMVLRCVDDAITGMRYPLHLIAHLSV